MRIYTSVHSNLINLRRLIILYYLQQGSSVGSIYTCFWYRVKVVQMVMNERWNIFRSSQCMENFTHLCAVFVQNGN